MLCSLYYQVNINKEDPWTNILNYKQYSLGPDYDTNNNNEKGIYVQISTSPTCPLRKRSWLQSHVHPTSSLPPLASVYHKALGAATSVFPLPAD